MRVSDLGRRRRPRGRPAFRSVACRILLPCALLSVPGAGPGCNTSCDEGDDSDDPPVLYEGGNRDQALTYYESDTWDGVYLKFPPQRTYDLVHGLGRAPSAVMSYVGFSHSPLGESGNGNVALATGNLAIIEWVDDTIIRVRNDTCETFYLRVVAMAPGDGVDPGAGAAGAGGTAG